MVNVLSCRMPIQPYHTPVFVGDQLHDLSHLAPFTFEVASAKVPRPLRINVRFTNHCFSEAFDPSKNPANAPFIFDGQRRRVFSPERYALSSQLPVLIRSLADPHARVNQTAARRNWMYAAIVEVPTTDTRYHTFFTLRRTVEERRRLQDLDMVVESAYPVSPGQREPNILGRMSFLLLAGSVYLGKSVTTRR